MLTRHNKDTIMIIDFHTHMFPDKIAERTITFLESVSNTRAFTDGTYKGLEKSSIAAGIDVSVALPIVTNPAQFDSIHRFASTYKEGSILSFGSIHPESINYKEQLLQIKDMGLKGIKLHPDYQEVYFNDIRYKRIISFASELGFIIIVHAGEDPKCPDDVHCTPQMAAEMLDDVRPEKLVLAHMGGMKLWDEVEEQLVGRDVYFDTGVVFKELKDNQLIRMIRTHGADKILFGTDSPWATQREYVNYLHNLAITEEERELIFYKNAVKLLKLD